MTYCTVLEHNWKSGAICHTGAHCLCEWDPGCVQCWLLSSRNMPPSHCPCQMKMYGTTWKPVASTSHHCHTLVGAVVGYQLPTCLVSMESVLLLGLLKWGQFFCRWSPCWTVTAVLLCTYALNHMTMNTRALCRIYIYIYVWTPFEISPSSALWITGLVNFFCPSYSDVLIFGM